MGIFNTNTYPHPFPSPFSLLSSPFYLPQDIRRNPEVHIAWSVGLVPMRTMATTLDLRALLVPLGSIRI